MKCWAIITNGDEIDQCCYSEAEAKREVKDLRGMGIDDVKIRVFPSDADAYDWSDRKRGVI